MNPLHNSNQNPAAVQQQVNSVINQQPGMLNPQQMYNGNVGGLFPNNRPISTPSSFTNFLNQPFPLQNAMGQFPNGIGGFNPQQNFNPFPVNQFNPSQQQQGQFFTHNPMNPTAYNQNVGLPSEQVVMQNTIQNICQLLQLQNPNHAQFVPGNFPMFSNQGSNVMGPQNPGLLANQQMGMASSNGPMQQANQGQQRFVSPMMDVNASKQMPNKGQQLQGNPLLPHVSGSVQTPQTQNLLATLTNLQNQIAHGMGSKDPSFLANQLFGIINPHVPVQQINQGQQRFVSPMMNVNASKQSANTTQQLQGSLPLPHASGSVQTQKAQNPCPLTNFQDNQGNMPANVNAEWSGSQRKNFTAHKKSDSSPNGFNSEFRHAKHARTKFGIHNGNMNKGCNTNAAANSFNQIHVEKKAPSPKYTEQEIKQWREARKKHYPTKTNVEKNHKEKQMLSEAANQEAKLRCQQLKEILAKQAELGCEVAEIPTSYLSDSQKQIPGGKKHKRERHKKGRKSLNKRGTETKTSLDDDRITKKMRPNKKEPSLLQKLLTRDVKRDKSQLLQVFRFVSVNSFFTGENQHDKSLRFPSVIVRESSLGVAEKTTNFVSEGEIRNLGKRNVEALLEKSEEEEGEITD